MRAFPSARDEPKLAASEPCWSRPPGQARQPGRGGLERPNDHIDVIARFSRNIATAFIEDDTSRFGFRGVHRLGILAMTSRRHLIGYAAIAASLFALPAFAAETVPYTPAAFDAAQKAGKSILVEIHAPWCPTCKAQAPILAEIEKGDGFKNLLVLHVDFDSQKEAVARFGARMQSTLITFKGANETGRSVGETNPGALAALLGKAI